MKETFHGIKALLILAHVCRRGLELVTVRKLVDRRNKLEQRFRKLRLSAFDVRDPVCCARIEGFFDQAAAASRLLPVVRFADLDH